MKTSRSLCTGNGMERITDAVRRFISLAAFLPFLLAASLDAHAMVDERRQIALFNLVLSRLWRCNWNKTQISNQGRRH